MANLVKQKPKKSRNGIRCIYDNSETIPLPSPSSQLPAMRPPSRARFLIASLGNPGPLATTRHSAGHILLGALASALDIPLPDRSSTTTTSFNVPQYTLYRSNSLMNVSGRPLLSTYKQFILDRSREDQNTTFGLYLLHDDLETVPGKIKIRRGTGSSKGHNGIKSTFDALRGAGLMDKGNGVVRVGIGIGRPEGRTNEEVVPYVMKKLSGREKEQIEGCAQEVVKILEEEVLKVEGG
ncbi:MAG: hypothetical protein Q9227_009463 [Pyrenula ochraceoflavens]